MSTMLALNNEIYHAVIEETSLAGDTINPGKYTPGELTKVVRVSSSMHGIVHSLSILCSYMTDLENAALLKRCGEWDTDIRLFAESANTHDWYLLA